jgi:glycosyltransferase involved in cell wall biosynthesis
MFVNVDWFFFSHRLVIAEEAFKNQVDMHVYTDFTMTHEFKDYSGFKLKKSPIKRANKSFFRLFLEFVRTYFLVKKEKPELIHAVTVKPIIFLGVIARITKTPFIGAISGLGPAFISDSVLTMIRSRIVILIYRFIFSSKQSHAICQSTHDQDVLIKNNIIFKDKTTLIPGSGVDLNQYKPIAKISSSRRIVFMASRLLIDKGVIEFCKSAQIVKNNYSGNVDFKLAGSIDYLSPSALSLEDVKNLCKKNHVEYLGEVNCVNTLLAEADLFVYPSYYPEGIPKILLEASSCGTPIITTDHPGCRDAIIKNETGILVPIRDPNAIAKEIVFLLNDKKKCAKFSARARLLAEDLYSEEEVISKHYILYGEFIKKS